MKAVGFSLNVYWHNNRMTIHFNGYSFIDIPGPAIYVKEEQGQEYQKK